MEHVKPPPSSAATSRCSRRPNLTLPLTQRQSLPLSPPSSTRHSPHHPQISTISLADLDRERRIGGTVYMARNRSTGTSYALKIINADHEDFVRRQIFRQIRILCTIDNPNVVKCHGMFDDAGEIQVVLDYMDGGSLQGTLISNESSLADVARQILCGLSYLHGRKFAHHDIKPSNFLINSQSHVKIAGFGISRTLSQTSVSTIAYISPERIHTDHLSHGLYNGLAGDIWSFGVSILELYLGRFPFEVDRRNDWESLISAICVSQPPEAPASASPEFRHLVACCLQKDQANRWTAAQLLQHPFILHNTL